MQIDITENQGSILLDQYEVLILNNASELTKVFDQKQRERIRDWYPHGRRDYRLP